MVVKRCKRSNLHINTMAVGALYKYADRYPDFWNTHWNSRAPEMTTPKKDEQMHKYYAKI